VLLLGLLRRQVRRCCRGLARKRRLWWRKRRRNRLIAARARALAAGDIKALRQAGVKLRRRERRAARDGWAVAVLVESTEHGAALLELLPLWQLHHAVRDAVERHHSPSAPSKSADRCAHRLTVPVDIPSLSAMYAVLYPCRFRA
jgi:hypothetical protein